MYHFYVENSSVFSDQIHITGADVNHMKNVLRMRQGEKIIICNGQGKDYYCIIDRIEDQLVVAAIENIKETDSELATKIYLFQGLPKKDKMEMIIQKAVELGVCEIIPVITRRTIVKFEDSKKEQKKMERWQAIAESAAKQSGRGYVPKIAEPVKFHDALKKAAQLEVNLIPYEAADGVDAARKYINGLKEVGSIGVFIGPEGGFEQDEVIDAKAAGAHIISLGKRILRTETAGLAMLSILMFTLERG